MAKTTHTDPQALEVMKGHPRGFEQTRFFENLLDRDNTNTTNTKNLQKLMIKIYKSFIHLNPEYMRKFFVKIDVNTISALTN